MILGTGSPLAGVVRELRVKVGDEINSGALVAMIEVAETRARVHHLLRVEELFGHVGRTIRVPEDQQEDSGVVSLAELQSGKPIVAFKIGRSEAGAKAAVSHTGALAGADRMYDALFRQCGVIRAQTFDDLLDIPVALATGRKLRGNRVAILTSTGGAGTLVSDSLGVSGFDTPAPDAETAAALRALQTGDHAALDRNPIDVTLAGLQPDLLRSAIKILLASPSYDALTIIVGLGGAIYVVAQGGAPAILTNTQAGRRFRAFVKFSAERPTVVEVTARGPVS